MATITQYNSLTQRLRPKPHQPRRREEALVREINAGAEQLKSQPDAVLSAAMQGLRDQVAARQSILSSSIVVSAFALTKEAARRVRGVQLYDTQLLAGLAMASGAIAEMQTGEGKTLAATLPAVLHALTGQGVHVSTVNQYLAQRDYEELAPLFDLLGLSVGLSADGGQPGEKRQAYACDVTYVTGYEVGFDFLRDEINRRQHARQPLGQGLRQRLRGQTPADLTLCQRGHVYTVIDEADSVLIDEATTPLVLSGSLPASRWSREPYLAAAQIAAGLQEGIDYDLNTRERLLRLTQSGADLIHQKPPPAGLVRPWSVYLEQALRAAHLYRRQTHYVVQEGEVRIVDENTGRIFTERSWRDGLHQAVEVKEGVEISPEKQTLARISRQRYFQLYQRLAGLTGTIAGHEGEMQRVYRLPVVVIPRRKPSRRDMLPTRYFPAAEAKYAAIAEEVRQRRQAGQPVLVGTRTIEQSRELADLLAGAGLHVQLLNGLQDADEADLIAAAGRAGAITIATNMAGRGTDIRLDEAARQAGGLHVVAAQRHDSIRIDRQLIGRCARQADPGSARFFVSADDELLQRRDAEFSAKLSKSLPTAGAEQPDLDAAIARLQAKAECENYALRQRLMRQELWLNEVLNTLV